MPFSSTDDYIFIKATARIKTDNNSTNTSLRSVIKEIKGYFFENAAVKIGNKTLRAAIE